MHVTSRTLSVCFLLGVIQLLASFFPRDSMRAEAAGAGHWGPLLPRSSEDRWWSCQQAP